MMTERLAVDVLVLGAGPAGTAVAAALASAGLRVAGLTPVEPTAPWINSYGIWRDELEPLGLVDRLGPTWSDCIVYMGSTPTPLSRTYGLFDNTKLQSHLLAACERGGVRWEIDAAAALDQDTAHTKVRTRTGATRTARLVVDASGHFPAFVQRPPAPRPAYQAAYGVVGVFSQPPVAKGQLVLMDYRDDHLQAAERVGPPTFLYAMDLGDGRHFVEETSLAHAPALSFDLLERRLHSRLAAHDVKVQESIHVERCLFPMDLPLPFLNQSVLGFGGAASMVHPASGYLVGRALRAAPVVAQAVAAALGAEQATPAAAALAGWKALWPADRQRRRSLYLFGLASLLRMDGSQLRGFFNTFFALPLPHWSGYLSDTLTTEELVRTMLTIFRRAPADVRLVLARSAGGGRNLLWQGLRWNV